MESFLKRIFENSSFNEDKKYFLRFGKGNYERRFLISFDKGSKIKIRGSFEWANDFVKFVRENKNVSFSGSVLMKNKVPGREGRKKGGSFLYEINGETLEEFENAYYYLLNVNEEDIVLKIKKSLPKPGKEADKIDDKFCSLELDLKYWESVKSAFFWDVGNGKKCKIEHTIKIHYVEFPSDVSNPVKIRELAKRKGKIFRKIELDGKEVVKEYELEV